METSQLSAGDVSPLISVPVPDTCATSYLTGEDLNLAIYIVDGTGFDLDAVSDGQIDIAIEKQNSMAFFLLRFQTLKQVSYLTAGFDALNTSSSLTYSRVLRRFSPPNVVPLRIWMQDERGIIQAIRHTRLPLKLQLALVPILRRQMKSGRRYNFYEDYEMMQVFMKRTGDPSLAFEKARIKWRVS